VNHDGPAGIDVCLSGPFSVCFIGIRDMNRLVKGAMRVFIVKNIPSFRCSTIPLFQLVARRVRPERNMERDSIYVRIS